MVVESEGMTLSRHDSVVIVGSRSYPKKCGTGLHPVYFTGWKPVPQGFMGWALSQINRFLAPEPPAEPVPINSGVCADCR